MGVGFGDPDQKKIKKKRPISRPPFNGVLEGRATRFMAALPQGQYYGLTPFIHCKNNFMLVLDYTLKQGLMPFVYQPIPYPSKPLIG